MNKLATYLLTLAWLLLPPRPAAAQAVTRYTLAASTGTYTALTSAAITPVNNDTDDGQYRNLPLGFTFRFRGANYTTATASANGFLSFGAITATTGSTNNLSTGGTASLPILAPLWDDLLTPTFRTSTTGTAPYRVFTAEWAAVKWNLNSAADVVSFQVKLYETTSRIQYVYTPGTGAVGTGSGGASVGMAGASGEFISVSDLTTSATLFRPEINNITTKPAAGLTFTFDLQYDFAPLSGTYAALPTPAAAPADAPVTERAPTSGSTDDGFYAGIPLGFSFVFRGNVYSQVRASTNGWLTFDTPTANPGNYGVQNDLTTGGGVTRPLLAPLWDDLDLAGGTLRTQTTGTAPNRICTVEWAAAHWNFNSAANVISFQVKLFETSNRVWYVYQQGPAPVNAGSNGASIGLAGADGYFLSLTNTGTAPATSATTETKTLLTKPATGQVYAFAPAGTTGGPLPVQLSAFTARRTALSTVALAWATASETSNAGFGVEKSANGQAWVEAAFVAGAGNSQRPRSYAATDASAAPTYYRLRQTDLDGTATYSPIRFVPGSEGAVAFAAYPNPAHGPVRVVGAAGRVVVYNARGEAVRTFAAATQPLDVSGLPAGIYYLQSGPAGTRLVVE